MPQSSIKDLAGLLKQIKQESSQAKKLPPVHLWNPPFCGDIDMRIARDGKWYYMGTPIGRSAMVKLFSTIMRRDEDNFYLVTPVEKVGIQVEDAPFVVVLMEVIEQGKDQIVKLITNVEDEIYVGSDHPLRVEYKNKNHEPAPYVLVRDRLEALISRNVFYQMVDIAEEKEIEGKKCLGIWSQGQFYSLGCLDVNVEL